MTWFSNTIFACACVIVLGLGSCRTVDNSLTYFNTYYNANKLMNEAEDEFAYTSELKRQKPRVLVPEEPGLELEKTTNETPKFLKEFIIEQSTLQPVQVKVDSIIIKGSKILGTHPKSDFIDKSLFLMGKAYFYRSEWYPSQVKAQELIEQFPNSSLSPDAHLLLSKSLLIQRKFPKGKQMLSRTIDIAWEQKRYDILSEAFRLLADTWMFEGNLEEAQRPYRQAIIVSEDDELKAKWQNELASLLFRKNEFSLAQKEYERVRMFSPEPIIEFESRLYEASCLTRLNKLDAAEKQLVYLEEDGKFKDWQANVYAEKMRLVKAKGLKDSLRNMEVHADTSFTGNTALLVANFERGLDYFKNKSYDTARKYFSKSKIVRSPVFDGSSLLYQLLNTREEKQYKIQHTKKKIAQDSSGLKRDSLTHQLAHTYFELGRTNELMGNLDSAESYYLLACRTADKQDTSTAQYLFSLARMYDTRSTESGDSLHEIIFAEYSNTEFGKEAQQRLGYTNLAKIDTCSETFLSGSRLRTIGDYSFALRQFNKVVQQYPTSDLAPRALYSIGWVWEKNLKNNDSALFYYRKLLGLYPSSEYSKEIRPSVVFALSSSNKYSDSTLSPLGVPKQGLTLPTDSVQQKIDLEPKNPAPPPSSPANGILDIQRRPNIPIDLKMPPTSTKQDSSKGKTVPVSVPAPESQNPPMDMIPRKP